jgi:hypothetical protein
MKWILLFSNGKRQLLSPEIPLRRLAKMFQQIIIRTRGLTAT